MATSISEIGKRIALWACIQHEAAEALWKTIDGVEVETIHVATDIREMLAQLEDFG